MEGYYLSQKGRDLPYFPCGFCFSEGDCDGFIKFQVSGKDSVLFCRLFLRPEATGHQSTRTRGKMLKDNSILL